MKSRELAGCKPLDLFIHRFRGSQFQLLTACLSSYGGEGGRGDERERARGEGTVH